jgi:hypothetical protein
MILGVSVPAFFIVLTEIFLRFRKSDDQEFLNYLEIKGKKAGAEPIQDSGSQSSDENKKGLRMIAIGIGVTGLIIGVLGVWAPTGKIYVLGMAFLLLLIAFRIFYKTLK